MHERQMKQVLYPKGGPKKQDMTRVHSFPHTLFLVIKLWQFKINIYISVGFSLQTMGLWVF